jgi:hypothetical protein
VSEDDDGGLLEPLPPLWAVFPRWARRNIPHPPPIPTHTRVCPTPGPCNEHKCALQTLSNRMSTSQTCSHHTRLVNKRGTCNEPSLGMCETSQRPEHWQGQIRFLEQNQKCHIVLNSLSAPNSLLCLAIPMTTATQRPTTTIPYIISLRTAVAV